MKVAILLPGGVDRGGVARVIHARLWLIERLAQRHEVHVFATRQEASPGAWDLLGARVHSIGAAPGTSRRLLARFAPEHRARAFDVIHAFFGLCGTYAAALGMRYRVPVLFHPSGGEFVSLDDCGYGMRQTVAGRVALRAAIAGADTITVSSRPMQNLAASCGVNANRVPLGVALDRWPPLPPRGRSQVRPARLLHVGDLRPVKDQQMLMRAAARLLDAGVCFELDVVGLDTMGGVLQRSPAARRIASRTTWHGPLRHDALRPLMENADLLLVTSRHEAGPLVVLEAAIVGVPTVGTAVGHVAEWAGDASVAVPVGDDAALAHEIASLLADEPRRMALATEAQRRALEIDADFTAAAFERIYERLARKQHRTQAQSVARRDASSGDLAC